MTFSSWIFYSVFCRCVSLEDDEGPGGARREGCQMHRKILHGREYDWMCRGIVLDLCWICRLVDLYFLAVVIVFGLMSLVESFGSKDLLDCLLTMNVGRRNEVTS